MKKIIFFVIAYAYMTSISLASFQDANEIVSLGWGSGQNQVGISYGDTEDDFPGKVEIDKYGHLLIPDFYNGRLHLFSAYGLLLNYIIPSKYRYEMVYDPYFVDDKILMRAGEDYMFYDYSGNLVNEFKGVIYTINEYIIDGNIIVLNKSDKKYYKYSSTGELLNTYTKRPLELGLILSSDRQTDGTYKTVIQYNDVTYNLQVPTSTTNFTRVQTGHVLAVVRESVGSVVVPSVYKYDRCGKELGKLDMPTNNILEEPDTIPPRPTPKLTIIAEYGEPIISSNGDVYTWRRSTDNYSIIKWAWMDEATDPKGGPDAPVNLNALPSISGIYLSWGISPSDPGCVTGYEVERATSSNGIFTTVSTVAAGVLNFNDTTATQGSTYFYKIRAVAGGVASDYTGVVSGTRP